MGDILSVLISRVVLCVIACTERSSIHSHSRCEPQWSVSSYTITAAGNKLPEMCLDWLSLQKSLYVKTEEWTHCLILQSRVRSPVNDIPAENMFREAVGRICCYYFKPFFLMLLRIKERGKRFHWAMLCHRDWSGKCVLDGKLSGKRGRGYFPSS